MEPSIEKLSESHEITCFSCDIPMIDDFIRNRALRDMQLKGSVTYVIADESKVISFVTILTSAFDRIQSGRMRRIPFFIIPATLISYVGTDTAYRKKGHASKLIRHAVRTTLSISEEVGFRIIWLDALTAQVKWYGKL